MKYISFLRSSTTAVLYFMYAFSTMLHSQDTPARRIPKSLIFNNYITSDLWVNVHDAVGKLVSPARYVNRFLPAGSSIRIFYPSEAKFPLTATFYRNTNQKKGNKIKTASIKAPRNPLKREEVIRVLGKADNGKTLRIDEEQEPAALKPMATSQNQ